MLLIGGYEYHLSLPCDTIIMLMMVVIEVIDTEISSHSISRSYWNFISGLKFIFFFSTELTSFANQ